MIDPKKLALPVQPVESHALDLSQRKSSPAAAAPTSRLVVDARHEPAIARLHITDAAGGTWLDPESRQRHKGKALGPEHGYGDDPVKVARAVVGKARLEASTAKLKVKRKRGKR